MSSTNANCGSNNGSASVSVSGGSSPYSYTWSNAGTGPSISGLAAGGYSVTVTDNAACSASASVNVGSSGGSGGSVSISANKSFICQDDTARICATSGFASYQWSNGGSGECISVGQAGMYDVTVTNNGSCSAVSGQLQIQVYSPTISTITVNGNSLSCTTLASYQWYLNGQAISGATSNVYVATQSGNYSVIGADLNGCSSTSNSVYVNLSGIDDLSEDNIRIHPNPTTSFWQMQLPANWIGAQYELFNADGQLISKAEITSTTTTISNELSQGIYFIKIQSGQVSLVKKVIKL